MTHDDLRDLLDASAGTPPRDLDPDALLATAGRRRTARLGAGLVAGAAVVLAGVLVLPNLLPAPQRATPAAPPPATVAASPTVEPGCPEPSPVPGGGAVAIDYVDVLHWGGRSYLALGGDDIGVRALGDVVGVVRCSIDEIGEGGSVPVPAPWPDGTATFVPAGTPIRVVAGQDDRCYLATAAHGGMKVFAALDADADVATPEPACADVPEPTRLSGAEASAELTRIQAADAAWRAEQAARANR